MPLSTNIALLVSRKMRTWAQMYFGFGYITRRIRFEKVKEYILGFLSFFVFIRSRIFPFGKFRDDRRFRFRVSVFVIAWDNRVVENAGISTIRQIGEFIDFFGGFGVNVQGFGYLIVAHSQKV